MILEQLTVRNFCLFHGKQVFNLAPDRRNGKHLPIILFGGINGGGKTTLLDAIQLALYGQRARCSKRTNLAYDDFLRESMHRGLSETESAGVTLSFRYSTDGTERLYDVSRVWKVTEGRVREELRVFQDGLLDNWLSDNWPQLVEELFPLEISQLFFFDAEKIRNLAEDESSSKALGAAIKSLLGLDIVERLITDSTVLQTRLTKKAGSLERQAELELLEQSVRTEQSRLDNLVAERAALENTRQRLQNDANEAEQAFAASGGKHWEARKQRERRLGEVSNQEAELHMQLVTLASGELPLVLVSDLLAGIERHDRQEREAADAELIQRVLVERDEALLEMARSAKAPTALLRRLSEHLAADRLARQTAGPVTRRVALSPEGHAILRQLTQHKLKSLRAEAGQILERFWRTCQEQEELEQSIAAAPAEADIAAIAERFKTANQAFAAATEQCKQLDIAVTAQRDKVTAAADKLKKILEGKMEKAFAHQDAHRMMELAGRTRATMQEFLKRVTDRKIDRLSGLITESFRFLLRKQTLVEQILIDPATFAITVYDNEGQALAKQRFSEGEKQIFAISILWGLARAAARPLPAVIDTPMARLDAAQRQHLVERYFPNASHQVVIFSTDTEVDRQYYQALQPYIARAYHLNYDGQNKKTVGEEGYFW